MVINRRSLFTRLIGMFSAAVGLRADPSVRIPNAELYENKALFQHGWSEARMAESLGRLSRLLPDNYVMTPHDPMTLAEDIHTHIKTQRDESERREVSLAGVSVAALGGTQNPALPKDWAWHPAYQDVLNLRRKFDASLRILGERIPAGQQIMLYTCGCSALGNLPDGEMLPLQCGDPNHTDGGASIVRSN